MTDFQYARVAGQKVKFDFLQLWQMDGQLAEKSDVKTLSLVLLELH